jgi:ketosteroid isomerase-like protein
MTASDSRGIDHHELEPAPMVLDRTGVVREFLAAFAESDREAAERILAEDFTFSAPPDPHLDRAGFFERCWPGAGGGRVPDITRLFEHGDEVVVTYERPAEGGTGCNTEILTFRGDRIVRSEVYFGWTTPDGSGTA